MDTRPIGIFDSGIGGLTVLGEIVKELPLENTLYLGDTARVPYGTKSAETVTRYSLENAAFLSKHNIKLLVIACNTASAYSLEALQKTLSIPVIGVVLPGARMAVEASRAKRVGVTGTEGTIKSTAYFDAIKSFDDKVVVYSKACPLFVPLAEEGWIDNNVTDLVVGRYLEDFKQEPVDVVLLGCTHYPLLKKAISRFMGKKTKLVDSASATAKEVHRVLCDEGLLHDKNPLPERKFFVTDSPERFKEVGERFFGQGLISAELVRVGD